MLDVMRFIFSSIWVYLGTIIILWMLCPWLHTSRKRHVHILGTTHEAVSMKQKKDPKREDQFVVQG